MRKGLAEADRRTVLAGAAIALLAPPAAAQPTPGPSPGPTVPATVHRSLRARAERVMQRLGKPDAPESAMFRLVPLDADGNAHDRAALPVFRAKEGEAFTLEIDNALDQPLAFHVRGRRGPNGADGMPGLTTSPTPPGNRLSIPIDALQSGTFILSPTVPELIAEQNARGLHGAIIVEEKSPPAFDHDVVLAVSDWRLDDKGLLSEDFLARRDSARVGRLGNRLVANGAAAPDEIVVRPGARLRVRMINVANARAISLKVAGFPAEVYSIDSTPCQPFDPLKRTVVLAPGARIEMALQSPREPGQTGTIEARLGDGLPIFIVRTLGEPAPDKGKLAPLPDPGLPPAIRLQDAVRAEVVIAGGSGAGPDEAEPAALEARFRDMRAIYTINGARGGFGGKPVASLKRGRVLVLALVNRTAFAKVIAVHGHAFRLLHAFDDGWEPYFLDTLYLQPNTTARIALIADNPGKWAIRSTIAEHYATGVATWFEVT